MPTQTEAQTRITGQKTEGRNACYYQPWVVREVEKDGDIRDVETTCLSSGGIH